MKPRFLLGNGLPSIDYRFRLVEKGATSRKAAVAAAMNQCEANYRSPELDPIRNKVEFLRRNNEAPPPFEMAADESFASDVERKAIAQWAKLREACIAHEEAAQPLPPGLSPLQVTYYENTRAFSREAGAKVSELVVFLYQQKLTYGEFAKKRYEITRDLASAERRFRESRWRPRWRSAAALAITSAPQTPSPEPPQRSCASR